MGLLALALLAAGAGCVWLRSRPKDQHADAKSPVGLLLASASDADLNSYKARAAFTAELHKASKGGTRPVLEALQAGHGGKIARTLAIIYVGKNANENDLADLCKIYDAAQSRADKIAALQAMLLPVGKGEKRVYAFIDPEVPGLMTDMGPIRTKECALRVLDTFSKEQTPVAKSLAFSLAASQGAFPDITDAMIALLDSNREMDMGKEDAIIMVLAFTKTEAASRALRKEAGRYPDSDVRRTAAIGALAEQDTPLSVSLAVEALAESKDLSDLLGHALEALSWTKDAASASKVDGFLATILKENPVPAVRIRVAGAIVHRSRKFAYETLSAALQSEGKPEVKAEIEKALGLLKELQRPNH